MIIYNLYYNLELNVVEVVRSAVSRILLLHQKCRASCSCGNYVSCANYVTTESCAAHTQAAYSGHFTSPSAARVPVMATLPRHSVPVAKGIDLSCFGSSCHVLTRTAPSI